MTRNYSSPRYKNKSRPGRKSLDEEKRRKLITARIAPDAYKYLMEQDIKIGLLIDRLVRKEVLFRKKAESYESRVVEEDEIGGQGKQKSDVRETFDFDAPQCLTDDPYDLITEQARGLIALIVERGTSHLTQEHIDILSNDFALLVNNYLATFKKRA